MSTKNFIFAVVVSFTTVMASAGTITCSIAGKSADGSWKEPVSSVAFETNAEKQVLLQTDQDGSNATFTMASFNPTGPSLQLSIAEPVNKKIYALSAIANISNSNAVIMYDPLHDRMVSCLVR